MTSAHAASTHGPGQPLAVGDLARATGLTVRIADDPMSCVALGAGRTLEEKVLRGALMAA